MSNSPAIATNDTSFDHYGLTEGEVIGLTVASSAISSIGTVSNLLLILAVLSTKQLRESFTAVLLISLSVCDALICSVYVPMYIWDIHHGASTTFENARWVMGFCLFLATLNGELIVYLERFIYIRFPYHYTNWMCKKYIAAATFCTQWFIAVALTLPLAFTRTPLYSVFYIAVLMAAMVSLHLYIYCFARQESQKIAHQYPAGSQSQRMPLLSKSATTVAMAVLATVSCWAPIVILPAIMPPSSSSFKRYVKIAASFTSLSAAVHPFIFCWKLQYFRNALANCLRKLRNAFRSAWHLTFR